MSSMTRRVGRMVPLRSSSTSAKREKGSDSTRSCPAKCASGSAAMSMSGLRGRGVVRGSHPPIRTRPLGSIRRANSFINEVLPDPASPEIIANAPAPSPATSTRCSNSASSPSRSNSLLFAGVSAARFTSAFSPVTSRIREFRSLCQWARPFYVYLAPYPAPGTSGKRMPPGHRP